MVGWVDPRTISGSIRSLCFELVLLSFLSVAYLVPFANAEEAEEAAAAAVTEEPKTGELVIEVSNLNGDAGSLTLALLTNAESFEDGSEPFRHDSVPVKDGKATVVFRDLPFGAYAAKVFQDENSNGELDTNFVGFPTEAFGFSNDAMGRFGPPTFEEAKFEFAAPRLGIEIHAN
jgi:uncharacterized protein (DUF2141 family)